MIKKIISALSLGFVLTVLALSQTVVNAAQVKFNGYEVPIDIQINGSYLENSGKAYLDVDGRPYVPVRFVSEALGATVSWDNASGMAIVTKGNTSLVFDPTTEGCYINNTWTYTPQHLEHGVLYTDANFLLPSLGADSYWDRHRHEFNVTLSGHTVPYSYIESYYTPEDVYWLSKIVTCEAGSVSFDAQVMVANVVLNRRTSALFPNTVRDVIYDRKHGIQFTPAHNGKIDKANPSATTILACKAALNGTVLAPDCLYFVYASSKKGWVATHRELYKIVGKQAFYK